MTRIGLPKKWQDLRHDALLAQEQRIAAELLLLFYEDKAAQGRAQALPSLSTEWREPRHSRLKIDQRERAEAVMDFRLSDRPAVYLGVEGQTEVAIVTKVLGVVGIDARSSWISVVDLEGVDGDVKLLARSVAVPRLDPDGHRGARILSPLSALVVVFDPEKRYRTESSRAQVRGDMIEHVLKSLPARLRTPEMRRDLEYLIHVRSWDVEFEFAHFSNSELAVGIRSVSRGACPPLRDLRASLEAARTAGKPIKTVWKDLSLQMSKVDLVERLWPDLERRILNPRSRRPMPVVDLIEDVIKISNEVRSVRELAVSS